MEPHIPILYQEVSASTEEMSAGSQQITASVGELSVIAELAEQLEQMTLRFPV
ncbi:hypothetical protein [Cohnella terricola]|uniref:hypothetical protein n=1 Tax=Cohnella terricola TaxID=1289167 RepID=UPI0016459C3F|nr:hypothetical protein [Cohnella terricola]